MMTIINLSSDSRTLRNIDEELSVLNEKMRVTKEEISEFDKRLENSDAMIEKWRGKMRAEGEFNQTKLMLAEKKHSIP